MVVPDLTEAAPAARAIAEALGVGDLRAIETAAAWVESGRLVPRGAGLLALWRVANPDLARLGEPPRDPEPGAQALAAWCATDPSADPRTEASQLGWLVGVVRDRYLYRDGELARAASTRLVDRVAAELAAADDPAVQLEGLARIGAPIPAATLLTEAIARLSAEARRAIPTEATFDRDLGRATSLLCGGWPPTDAPVTADRLELAAAIATAPRDLLAWIADDPLAVAKAVARGAVDAVGWLDLLDGARRAVAQHARDLTTAAWQVAIATTRATAVTSEATEDDATLVAIAETEATAACERIGAALAGFRAGRLGLDPLIEVVVEEAG